MPRAKAPDTVVWAQPISGGHDPVQVPEICGPSPEFLRIKSQSQTGRSYKSKHTWKPPHVRTPKPPPEKLRSDFEEEQLLYVALYRDKIAQHQAQLAQGQEPRIRYGRRPSLARQAAGIGGSAAASPRQQAATWQPHSRAPIPPLPLPELPSLRGRAGHDDEEGRRGSVSARRKAQSARSADTRAGEVHHVAAVRAIPAYGGISTDHAETKQLGHLFDQWYTQQKQEREPLSPANKKSLAGAAVIATNASAAGAAGQVGGAGSDASAGGGSASLGSSSVPRRVRSHTANPGHADAAARGPATTVAGAEAEELEALEALEGGTSSVPAKDNPNFVECGLCGEFVHKRYLEAAGGTSSSWATGTSGNGGFGASLGFGSTGGGIGSNSGGAPGAGTGDGQGPPKSVEQVRTERLYNVITNRKVPFESFGERGAAEASSRREPTHVEGFPTLNLMRLYNGLWRLEI